MTLILWAAIGYLLGSIPFGIVITRALGLGDLRQIGSGNIGATNVLRTGNKPAALATLLLDSGKGVATFLGTLLALDWRLGLAACAIWLVTALVTRISSLSALVAAALSPLVALWLDGARLALVVAFMAALIFIRHHANIARIRTGTEPRIGKKS